MDFAALIIGDEIISGKRQDRHFGKLAEILAARGLRLSRVEYLGDDRERLTRVLRRTFADDAVVFAFGGIGNTPDDHTRQAAAAALDVPLVLHPEAERLLRERFGDGLTPTRLQLGTFPRGCAIVPNPFNRIPGFSVARHFFLPGFPQMAWPMAEWVLDTEFRGEFYLGDREEQALLLSGPNAYESALVDLMEAVVRAFPMLRLFSLPAIDDDGQRRHLELGVEGAPDQVAQAMAMILDTVTERGIAWTRRP